MTCPRWGVPLLAVPPLNAALNPNKPPFVYSQHQPSRPRTPATACHAVKLACFQCHAPVCLHVHAAPEVHGMLLRHAEVPSAQLRVHCAGQGDPGGDRRLPGVPPGRRQEAPARRCPVGAAGLWRPDRRDGDHLSSSSPAALPACQHPAALLHACCRGAVGRRCSLSPRLHTCQPEAQDSLDSALPMLHAVKQPPVTPCDVMAWTGCAVLVCSTPWRQVACQLSCKHANSAAHSAQLS